MKPPPQSNVSLDILYDRSQVRVNISHEPRLRHDDANIVPECHDIVAGLTVYDPKICDRGCPVVSKTAENLPSSTVSDVVDVSEFPSVPRYSTDGDIRTDEETVESPHPVSADFTSIMFLSTGGATIAVPSTPATNIRLGSNPSAFQGTATWREYNPYARRLFGRTILPVCTATYLTIALILYFATICNWACKDILTFVFTPIAASLALLVTMWTGSMAYRLRKHPVVINRGLVYVVQVHVGTLLGIPVVCVFALQHAGIFTPISAELTILNTYSSFCTFTFFSAVIARQRQIIHLFGLSSYRDAPKNKYRNTVFYIGTMYVVANIASVLFIYLWGDTDYSYLPVLLVDFLCMLMWFICAYQSRHASARFSDFDQLRRLVVMVGMGLIITIIWGYAQHEAFIVQSMVTLMLMIVFLLDSYLSLFRFIQYELDPRCVRDIYMFSSDLETTTLETKPIATNVATIQSKP